MEPKRILLIQLRQLGDILLTTPCTREIKRDNSNHHLTFVSHAMGRLVLADNPFIDELWTHDNSLGSVLRLTRKLAGAKFDIVIDAMGNPRSALFSLLPRGAQRISIASGRSFVYHQVVPRPLKSDYIVREKFAMLVAAGLQPTDEHLVLPWSRNDTVPLALLLSAQPWADRSRLRVVISPTHRRAARRWGERNYAALADHLVHHWNASVLWLWGPGEGPFVDRCMDLCTEKTERCPATTFREMAAVIANADLFVGNSNGPSHVAVATDICSLQLHGPTEAPAWSPLTQQHRALQGNDGPSLGLSLLHVLDTLEDFRPTLMAHRDGRLGAGVPRLDWMDPSFLGVR